MRLFTRDTGEAVRIHLDDAVNLSKVANSFGARSKREARLHPGGFNRPVVGNDPDYYSREADRVFRRAVKEDGFLEGLYLRARSLSHDLEYSIDRPYYEIGGLAVDSAAELVAVASNIREVLAAKDLKVSLRAKRVDRARDISSFAIRVLQGTDAKMKILENRPGYLYPGLPAHTPINTILYWYDLEDQLSLVNQAVEV